MDEKIKRSCYNCQHQGRCHLRRVVRNAIQDAWWMLGGDGAERQCMDVFDALGRACNQHEITEEETEV